MSYWPLFNLCTFVFDIVIHVLVTLIVFIDHPVGFVHHPKSRSAVIEIKDVWWL